MFRLSLCGSLAVFLFGLGLGQKSSAVSYDADVKPILDKHCQHCHNSISAAGGFYLESLPFTSMRHGNDQVKLVGLMLKRMRDPRFPMPPGIHLPHEDTDLIQHWLDRGLKP